MDKEEAEDMLNTIIKCSRSFQEDPTYEKALDLDIRISVLRYLIGEENFLALHYFRRMHEQAVKFIDEHDSEEDKKKAKVK